MIWPGPSSPGALGLLSVALASVVWTRGVINAFCFKADTSQIITYRCSKTFMWGRRMRVRLSDSGAAEDRKLQPGTRQSPGYTSLPDECVSKCNSKGICAGRGLPVFADFPLFTIHLQSCVSLPTNANVPGVREDKPQFYTSPIFLVPPHKPWLGAYFELGIQQGISGGRQCEIGSRQLDRGNTDKKP